MLTKEMSSKKKTQIIYMYNDIMHIYNWPELYPLPPKDLEK
jgi:hypothetical protein